MNDSERLSRLVTRLEYEFDNPDLLTEAVTHRSAAAVNNERLEFLGDSILNFVIANELYHMYPDSPEGDLSRLRASLVKKDGLAMIAKDLELGDFLILGSGELKSGGYRRDSILADAVEAILGAVYLDGGFEACSQLVLRLYREQLDNIPDLSQLKDPKTRLQELLQARKIALPQYQLLDVSGKAHQQTFVISCEVEELSISTQGRAGSRRKAEQLAAQKAIGEIDVLLKQVKQ
jgi:ribonuclease-3